jgi:ketosteroid isomerase-like protein
MTEDTTATEALRRWAACAVAGDSEGWSALTTKAMTYTHSNSMYETRDDVVAAFAAGRRYTRFDLEETRESLYGDAAVVTGITRAAVDREPPLELNLRFTATLVRADGDWRVAAYQTTPLPK